MYLLRKVKSDGEVQVADKKRSRQLCVYFLPQSFAVSDLLPRKLMKFHAAGRKQTKKRRERTDRDDRHHFQQQQKKQSPATTSSHFQIKVTQDSTTLYQEWVKYVRDQVLNPEKRLDLR